MPSLPRDARGLLRPGARPMCLKEVAMAAVNPLTDLVTGTPFI
jgi:hypothetical protein